MLGGYTLFDVNSNLVIQISEDMHDFLKANKSKGINEVRKILPSNLEEEFSFLVSQGCLLDNKPQLIEHPANRFLESLSQSALSIMILQVSKSCNFKCRYCAFADKTNLERNHQKETMTWEIAKASVDFLRKNSTQSKDITIGFYGGEPLLEKDLIKKIIAYANKLFIDKEIHYVMTTNLSLLTDDFIEVIESNNFKVAVSLDGPRELHNKNRRFANNGIGTYDSVSKQIQKLKSKLSDVSKITISAVIDPEEDYKLYSDYFKNDVLVKDLVVETDMIDSSRLTHTVAVPIGKVTNHNIIRLRRYLQLIINGSEINIKTPDDCESEIMDICYDFKPKNPLRYREHHQGPCVPGVRKLFVATNGNFLPCEKVSELSESMKIGDVNSGFNFDKMRHILNIGKLSAENCVHCSAIRHCKMCAKDIDNITELSADIKKSLCQRQTQLLRENIEKYQILKSCGLFDKI